MNRASAAALAVAAWLGTALAGPWWLALVGTLGLGVLGRLWRGSGAGLPAAREARPRRDRLLLLGTVVAVALVGSGLAGGRVTMRDAGWSRAAARPAPQTIEAVVVTEPRTGLFDSWMVVRMQRIGGMRVRARAMLRCREPPALGATVRLRGRVRQLPADDAFADHLRDLGTGVRIVPVGAVEAVAPPSRLLQSTTEIRDRFHETATAALGPERASVLTGLVTGDDRGRTPAVDDLLDQAGLRHLVVVSGRHTALFLAAVLVLARLTRRGFRTSRVLGLSALAWFVVLVRWQPSVLRAGFVAAVILLADLAGRDRDHVHLLAMAVVVLLFVDPLLGGRLGFALSVTATAGVLVLTQVVARGIPGPAWWRAALGVTVAAELAVAPVLVTGGHHVPVAGVVANVLAAPAAAVGQALGGAAALVTLLSPSAGRALAGLAGVPVDVVLWSARFAVRVVPASPPSDLRLLLVVVLLLVAVACAVTKARRPARVALVVAVVVAVGPAAPIGDVRVLTVAALDVGQGDAILVSAPAAEGTHRLLVDAGPDPGAVAGALTRLGVRRLDAVVISHAHADHSTGAAEVLRRLDVGALVLGPPDATARTDPSGDVRAAIVTARGTGIPVLHVHAGQSFRLGDAHVRVLWPPAHRPGLEVNDGSVVLRIDGRWGSALLTGDIEETAQRALLDGGAPLDVDLLKVPHHGGATNASDFIAATSPAVAAVSAGVDNDYGHPAASTIRALGATRTLRTDRDGDVVVRLGPRGLEIERSVRPRERRGGHGS